MLEQHLSSVLAMTNPVRRRPSFASDIALKFRHGGSAFEIANDNQRRRPASAAPKRQLARLHLVIMPAIVRVLRLVIAKCQGRRTSAPRAKW